MYAFDKVFLYILFSTMEDASQLNTM